MYNNKEYQYTNIATASTTQVFSGKGVLNSIVINGVTTNGTVTIADSTTTTTPAIGTISLSATPIVFPMTVKYEVYVANGLRIITSGTPDITVTWSKP